MLSFRVLLFLPGLTLCQYTKQWDPTIHIMLRPGYNRGYSEYSNSYVDRNRYYDQNLKNYEGVPFTASGYTSSYQTSPYGRSRPGYQTSPYTTDYSYQQTTPYQSTTNPSESYLYDSSTYGYKYDGSSQPWNDGRYGYETSSRGYYQDTKDNTPYTGGYNRSQDYNSSRNQFGINDSSNRNENFGNSYLSYCDDYAQRRINSCTYELTRLGAFEQTVGSLEKLTMSNFFRRSRDDFLRICDAYNLYNECVGGNSVKDRCYSREPFRSRYASADNALNYGCGEGYPSLFTNWYCIQEVASGVAYMDCTNIIKNRQYRRQNMDYQQLSDSYGSCSALQAYVRCIQRPVEDRCGRHASHALLTTIRSSGEKVLPYCTLAAGWPSHSVILLITAVIISFLPSQV